MDVAGISRCLQSDDDRVAMMAAQAILDRGYGRPTQSIDVREDGPTVRYIRRDASQGQDHRGVAQGQCGVPSVDQTRGRSLISWDRYSDTACMLIGSHLTPPPASIVEKACHGGLDPHAREWSETEL